MDAKFELIGIKNLKRKSDNKPMTLAICIADCTTEDNGYGNYGQKVIDFFLPDAMVGSLKTDALHKQFIPQYEISGYGKPMLTGYTLK